MAETIAARRNSLLQEYNAALLKYAEDAETCWKQRNVFHIQMVSIARQEENGCASRTTRVK